MMEATLIQQILADAGIDSQVVFEGHGPTCPACSPIIEAAA